MARPPFDINSSIPIFAEYFYATSLDESGPDIFNTGIDSFMLEPHPRYLPYDVVEKIITPIKESGVLKKDGANLLVPLEAQLILPDAPPATGKYPLLFILHGNHTGFARLDDQTFPPQGSTKGKWQITVLPAQKRSYTGYTEFQNTLADKGIASYSINLNIVNSLDIAEHDAFNEIAVDANQRILLFFLHLKLLKLIAGETLPDDKYPIRFLEGSVFKNIKDALLTSSHTGLMRLKTVLTDTLDFTRLGLMGHSRGADAVSRIPAYFFKGANAIPVTFPKHKEVDKRITDLAVQTGKPQQDSIKSILALQPVASKNKTTPSKHGYNIDSPHTMFFVGLGTHDEDVSFDPVRIYEYPVCPKAMIGINGATHKRFNTIWAPGDPDEFSEPAVKKRILGQPEHINLLKEVFGRCFTATLANVTDDFLYFTKERTFVVKLPYPIDVQCSWKFGFPFGHPTPVLKDLDGKLGSLTRKNLKSTSFQFEQEMEAFVEQRENAGIFTIRIPIDPASSQENLSKYTHFSFRFAKGYKLSKKNAELLEEKNFTIEFFENTNLVGKVIKGKDIAEIELKAIHAFDRAEITEELHFEYSILLQTAEIAFKGRFSTAELNKITSIEIKIVPDPKKSPPRPKSEVRGGSLAMGIVGGCFGLDGALVYNDEQDVSEDNRKWVLLGSVFVGAALGAGITYAVLKSEENAFAFNDFLLTNRQFP